MKYVLIRRDLFRHLAGLFKHFESDIMAYSSLGLSRRLREPSRLRKMRQRMLKCLHTLPKLH